MRKFIGCLVGLGLFCSVGCASKTVVKFGPVDLGARTEVHEFRTPSVTRTPDGESRLTVGNISVGVIGRKAANNPKLVSVNSATGNTADVDDTIK